MTPEDFASNGKLRDDLAEILNNPVFVAASAIASQTFEAQSGSTTDTNPVLCASRFQQQAGKNKFLAELRKLTETPKEVKKETAQRLARTLDDLPKEPD